MAYNFYQLAEAEKGRNIELLDYKNVKDGVTPIPNAQEFDSIS